MPIVMMHKFFAPEKQNLFQFIVVYNSDPYEYVERTTWSTGDDSEMPITAPTN